MNVIFVSSLVRITIRIYICIYANVCYERCNNRRNTFLTATIKLVNVYV